MKNPIRKILVLLLIGVLTFRSEFILASENGTPQINLVSNAACDCPTGTLSPEFQAGGLI